MTRLEKEFILGFPVVTSDQETCLANIESWIREGNHCKWSACINPHSYAIAKNNSAFLQALRDADWLIPDGWGIVLASKILGGAIRTRITGSDLFAGIHDRLNIIGGSVFFLGATDSTLIAIQERMRIEYPSIRIAGAYSPPFKPAFDHQDTDAMVAAINSATPDVLWVGMTSPKQDLWIYTNRGRLGVKFAAGVGAVFDFYTGRVKRSSPVFQKAGLEWLPRLIQEPRRLWRRMCMSAPIFLWDVLQERWRRGAN